MGLPIEDTWRRFVMAGTAAAVRPGATLMGAAPAAPAATGRREGIDSIPAAA